MNKCKTVDPIKSLRDIGKLKKYFITNEKYRDYCLFVVGINVGLRISDLLKIKIGDVWTFGSIKTEISIKEQKTNKNRNISINGAASAAIQKYIGTLETFNEEDFLFRSRKGDAALTKESCHRIIKAATKECGLKGNYGTHSLRKTFAYQLYIANSDKLMILEYLMKILNHSSQSITLKYIGLEKETLNGLVDNLNL